MKPIRSPYHPRNWPIAVKLLNAFSLPIVFIVIVALVGMSLFLRFNPTATSNTVTTVALILAGVAGFGVLWSIAVAVVLNNFVVRPFHALRQGVTRIASGDFQEPIQVPVSRDELGLLITQVNALGEQFRRDFQSLEQSVAARTRDLEAGRDIGRILSEIRDVGQLSNRVIELICDRFTDIYHAQVFLIDERRVDAVLTASTGTVGTMLITRGHRLEVGSRSVIGQVTVRNEYVLALDTAIDPVHKVNELLPETRSELALPMRTSGGVIGALDLQSRRSEAFSEAEIRLFQTIADQLSIAVQNARLFEESRARLRDIEDLNQMLIGQTWGDYIQGRRQRTGQKSTFGAIFGDGHAPLSAIQQQAVATGAIAEQIDELLVRFAAPVILRGQVLGVVEWEMPRATYTENTKALALELAARFALSADNTRLLEETRQTASREQLLNAISAKLTQQTDVERVLQTAVRELGKVLPVSQTIIRLTGLPDSDRAPAEDR